jgi:hypothetical protein
MKSSFVEISNDLLREVKDENQIKKINELMHIHQQALDIIEGDDEIDDQLFNEKDELQQKVIEFITKHNDDYQRKIKKSKSAVLKYQTELNNLVQKLNTNTGRLAGRTRKLNSSNDALLLIHKKLRSNQFKNDKSKITNIAGFIEKHLDYCSNCGNYGDACKC